MKIRKFFSNKYIRGSLLVIAGLLARMDYIPSPCACRKNSRTGNTQA